MANHIIADTNGETLKNVREGLRSDANPIVSASIDDAAVLDTGITETEGTLVVQYPDNSVIVGITNNGGTPTTTIVAGDDTNFSDTKATADKVNIYWETDQIKVQNLSGGALVFSFSGNVITF